MKKKLMSILLAITMTVGTLPYAAMTAGAETAESEAVTTVEQLQTAVSEGGTVKLGGDIDLAGTTLAFPDNIPVTIDLNGNTLSKSQSGFVLSLEAADNVTLTDTIGTGTVEKAGGWYFFYNEGYLTIDGGTYTKAGNLLVFSEENSTTDISGGTFDMENLAQIQDAGCSVRVSGGDFTFSMTDIAMGVLDPDVVITGGTFNVDPSAFVDTDAYEVTEFNGIYTVSEKIAETDTTETDAPETDDPTNTIDLLLRLKALDENGVEFEDVYALDGFLNDIGWLGTYSNNFDPEMIDPELKYFSVIVGENIITDWDYCPEGYAKPDDVTFTCDAEGNITVTSGNATIEKDGDVTVFVIQLEKSTDATETDAPETDHPENTIELLLRLKALDENGVEFEDVDALDGFLNDMDWLGTYSNNFDPEMIDLELKYFSVIVGENIITNWDYCPEGYAYPDDVTFTCDAEGNITVTSGNATIEKDGDVTVFVIQLEKASGETEPETDAPETDEPETDTTLTIILKMKAYNTHGEWISTEDLGELGGKLNGTADIGTFSGAEGYSSVYTVNIGENTIDDWYRVPEGYQPPSDITFTVDENGVVTLTSYNAVLVEEDGFYIIEVTLEAAAKLVESGMCTNTMWAFYDDGGLVITGNGPMDSYDHSVTLPTAAPWAKYRDDVTRVVISRGVTSIGDFAFYKMTNLEEVRFSDLAAVTYIGEAAFGYTGIKEITIPAADIEIAAKAFYFCDSLTTVDFEEGSAIAFIGNYAFRNCGSLVGITLPETIGYMGTNILYACPNVTVHVAQDSYAHKYAEYYGYTYETAESENYLATGTCGDSLTWILSNTGVLTITGSGAMDDFSFSTLAADAAPWAKMRGDVTAVIIGKDVTSVGAYAFYRMQNLTEVVFEEGSALASIGMGAFGYTSALTGITLPDSVETIGKNAFYFSGLEDITISCNSALTTIGHYAFRDTALTAVSLPLGLTDIGAKIFYNTDPVMYVVEDSFLERYAELWGYRVAYGN